MTSYIDRIPDEVLSDIILRLSLLDILHCRMVSVRFNLIIQNSSVVQYRIELSANGFVVCPGSTLTAGASVRMLRDQQSNWRRCEWKKERVVQIRPGCCTYDFRNGIAAFGRRGNSGLPVVLPGPLVSVPYSTEITCLRVASETTCNNTEDLPEWTLNLGIMIRDFIIDPLIDLLVLIEQTWNSPTVPFCVHFRKLSNGQPHELAAQNILHVETESSNPASYPVTVQIHGPNIGVMVRYRSPNDSDHFSLWNWRTGQKKSELVAGQYTFEDFIFIDNRTVIVAVRGPTSTTLRVIGFESPVVGHVGTFILPLLTENYDYRDMRFNGASVGSLANAKTLDGTPFAYPPEPIVLALSFGVKELDTNWIMTTYTMAMRPRLMFDALGLGPCGDQLFQLPNRTIPYDGGKTLSWDEWGPPCTRWIPHTREHLKWRPCLVGGRFAVITLGDTRTPGSFSYPQVIRLYDFRPKTVARYAKSHPQNVCTLASVISRGPILAPIFQQEIISKLPFYVVTSKPLPHELSGVMIDEGRLICTKAEPDKEWKTIFIHYF